VLPLRQPVGQITACSLAAVDHEPEGPSLRHVEPPALRPCAPTFDVPALFILLIVRIV
jgi:hypothetical protein